VRHIVMMVAMNVIVVMNSRLLSLSIGDERTR
jgi:hypothetical protein